MRPDLSDRDVFELLKAGCNAQEIAAYAGVSSATAWSMISHAHRAYSHERMPPPAPRARPLERQWR
ncbi:hypothetical protein [Lysobacter capsici]|uniref:hypothetical protein n=1 Tax=Lysobacter capsici TaxID=435897 RepID=UPI001C005597|nr:hypothetical protein [Lysobacter capsici]QWF19281.1 hypothetical protein KME82_11345 [Lysobacter capsici]